MEGEGAIALVSDGPVRRMGDGWNKCGLLIMLHHTLSPEQWLKILSEGNFLFSFTLLEFSAIPFYFWFSPIKTWESNELSFKKEIWYKYYFWLKKLFLLLIFFFIYHPKNHFITSSYQRRTIQNLHKWSIGNPFTFLWFSSFYLWFYQGK